MVDIDGILKGEGPEGVKEALKDIIIGKTSYPGISIIYIRGKCVRY